MVERRSRPPAGMKTIARITAVAALLMLSTPAIRCDVNQHIRFDQISIEQGLPRTTVHDIIQVRISCG